MTFLLERARNEKRLQKRRNKFEKQRVNNGDKHIVEYFHQVDDGYSYLTIQLLARLIEQYDIEFVIHLVPAAKNVNFPEPELWREMAVVDAKNIAPYYQLDFSDTATIPNHEITSLVERILSNMDAASVVKQGAQIMKCAWEGNEKQLKSMAEMYGLCSVEEVKRRQDATTKRREKLGHFGAANFFYGGEWYWKVDRVYHLEERLKSLHAVKSDTPKMVAPTPTMPTRFSENAQQMTLEYYVSLRSPYVAISWHPTLTFAEASGIKLDVKPVLPMVMRGVPATVNKGFYFWYDVAREAKAKGVDFSKFYDPIGGPVLQGYSLYTWALTQGKGQAVIEAFLKAAFSLGINLTKTSGMQKVAEMAGLDWAVAKQHLEDDSFQQALENNRNGMYKFGNWGVPSYRLLDACGNEILGVWGQDRLWLVAKKIEEHIAGLQDAQE